jgi:hypothetical protein
MRRARITPGEKIGRTQIEKVLRRQLRVQLIGRF